VAQTPEQTLGLVELSRAGDPVAFAKLVERNCGRLLVLIIRQGGRALRADCGAEDLCQEVLGKAWRLLGTYESQGPGSFYRWLAALALNTIRDRLKYVDAKGRGQVRSIESGVGSDGSGRPPIDPNTTAASVVAAREKAQQLTAALARLAPDLREVVESHVFEGLPLNEIAASAGIGKTTAWERLRRGLAELRIDLGPE
jgi:RNA polymerase sigma-70 factor, ECF subfamily